MKKYIQISFFLVIFGLFIVIKNVKGSDDAPVAVSTPGSVATAAGTPPPSDKPTVTPSPTPTPNNSVYKDGTFTGSVEDAYYGNIQAQAVIQNGRIVDVVFLQYPNDNRTSLSINSQAMPYLKEETLQAQSANIDIISGASDSSFAFRKSISTALSAAHK